jgi:hypothetical protein
MARHDVRFTIPERTLGNSDIEFTVYSDDVRLGVLKVSKGALVWRGANKKRGYVVAWDLFERLAREHGRREPLRPASL